MCYQKIYQITIPIRSSVKPSYFNNTFRFIFENHAFNISDYQKKVCQYQEDIDQLEGFQTQEMAKIKHLLLVMEQEIAEKDKLLKDNNSQMEALKIELARLRKFEQEYENIQVHLFLLIICMIHV